MTDAEKDPDLTIIIVSYETREMTLACIRSVIEQTSETSYELIGEHEDVRGRHAAACFAEGALSYKFTVNSDP